MELLRCHDLLEAVVRVVTLMAQLVAYWLASSDFFCC
jgi:hypothetical protein